MFRILTCYVFTHLILAEVLMFVTRWIWSCRVISTVTSRPSSSPWQEFNLEGKKAYHAIAFLGQLCCSLSRVLALRPMTTCVIPGESLNHAGLLWQLNNAVYVEVLCELQCQKAFRLVGSRSKWFWKQEPEQFPRTRSLWFRLFHWNVFGKFFCRDFLENPLTVLINPTVSDEPEVPEDLPSQRTFYFSETRYIPTTEEPTSMVLTNFKVTSPPNFSYTTVHPDSLLRVPKVSIMQPPFLRHGRLAVKTHCYALWIKSLGSYF